MSKASKKPSFLFIFSDDQDARQFYDFASSQEHATLVQHPIDAKMRASRDCRQVLVTGVGSLFFDITLHELLLAKAEELGGHYLP